MSGRVRRVLPAAAVGLIAISAGGCASSHTRRLVVGTTTGLAPGYGRLAGHVGPGAPPAGTVPPMTLVFTSDGRSAEATVTNGAYTVDLPSGLWSVRAIKVCATGLSIHAGAAQSDDLVYPYGGCQDLGPPGTPPTPPLNAQP